MHLSRISSLRVLFAFGALSMPVALCAQTPSAQSSDDAIPFAFTHRIEPGDTPEIVLAKAATVLPRSNQSDWMRLERTFFIHFGPNTFRGVEWGNGHEDPSIFNPTQLDADQWMRTVKEAGGTLVILVCKHHDGLALWPSRYTKHSVAASPWRGGKGDVVREVATAAQKYGIKLGVYLSPADLHQLRTNPTSATGYYGDGSASVRSSIPTDPASFRSDPARERARPAGKPSFTYNVDDYNRYFLNQLYELLTEYGPIQEVWFDGANPDPSVEERYDYNAWYSMIRKLQPKAIIFGKGPDGRWVGNEDGIGRTTEWDVIPLPAKPDDFRWPDMTDENLGSTSKLVPGSNLWWYPAEVNMPILYGWFWSPTKVCRTASDLIDRYYTSVGRNGNWLLNLSPDTRGLIPDDQRAQLHTMAAVLEKTFAVNLAAGAIVTSDSEQAGHKAAAILDGNLDSWWSSAAGRSTATLTLRLRKPVTFDVLSLQEAVDHRGQRIERFAVDAEVQGTWQELDAQTTVGHKRLLRLKQPVTTERVRIRILQSRLSPSIAEVGLYKQAAVIAAPEISQRDKAGIVTIMSSGSRPVVYTTDGTIPHAGSPVYRAPLDLRNGGTVQAAILNSDQSTGMVGEQHFAGAAPIGWKVLGNTANASEAIDDNPKTVWEVNEAASPEHPVSLVVDMGATQTIDGFTYLPRSDGHSAGTIERFRFETSTDGTHWIVAVAHGDFDNISHNPDQQEVHFPAVAARFFRLTALKTVSSDAVVSGAEVSVLLAGSQRR